MATDKPKQLTVTVSFKEEEKWLYDEIEKHSCKSAWIKEIIISHITNETYGKYCPDKPQKPNDNITNQSNNMMNGLL